MSSVVSSAATGNAVEFAHAARALAQVARSQGLVVPGFRSPPKIVGAQRTIRRHGDGAVVAVQVKGRPWFAVAADMIEGVVAANRLPPPAADRLRTDLWTTLGYELPSAAAPVVGRVDAPAAKVA